MRRLLVLAGVLTLVLFFDLTVAVTSSAVGPACTVEGTGHDGVLINGFCTPSVQRFPAGDMQPAAPMRVINCGIPSSKQNGVWNAQCGAPKLCYDNNAPANAPRTMEAAFATLIQQHSRWILQDVWCPQTADPVPSTAALRQQALRLLPHVNIGSAYLGNHALVNAETILWADTTTHRTLPTATVIGQHVHLRITLATAHWNFGDGTTATWTTPGKPYDPTSDPCHTAQCPHYTGHTYTHTGTRTITLTITWHAQFSLDNATTWTDIDPTALTGPTTHRTLHLLQSRAVLVPNP